MEYTSPLTSSALPSGGTNEVFAPSDFASHTAYEYNLLLPVKPDGGDNNDPNNLYFVDRVIDPMGLVTDTWKDPDGRVIWTVYPDQSYTYTQYQTTAFGRGDIVVPPGGSEVEKPRRPPKAREPGLRLTTSMIATAT